MISHRIPFPPNKGDKIRSYNIIRYLCSRHEIHLGALIDDPQDLVYISPLSEKVKSFVWSRISKSLKMVLSAVALLMNGSISVAYFYRDELQKKIDVLLQDYSFDVIICSSSPMAEYLFRSKALKNKRPRPLLIMDLIDVDSIKWRQLSDKSTGIMKWIYAREGRYLSSYEVKISLYFDHVLVVSLPEKRIMMKTIQVDNISVMSNGVDFDYFCPNHHQKINARSPIIIFTGVMDYAPNVEGVLWFVREILPRIRNACPMVSFYVVGNRPVAEVKRLRNTAGVNVTGFVEDVREFLAAADVAVAPLRLARGIQNKVLEAFAMGKAVVCTPQALEGISAIPGQDVLLAENTEGFAAAVVHLIQNPYLRRSIGSNARRFVENNCSWEKNLSVLDNILQKQVASSNSGGMETI